MRASRCFLMTGLATYLCHHNTQFQSAIGRLYSYTTTTSRSTTIIEHSNIVKLNKYRVELLINVFDNWMNLSFDLKLIVVRYLQRWLLLRQMSLWAKRTSCINFKLYSAGFKFLSRLLSWNERVRSWNEWRYLYGAVRNNHHW